MHGKENYYKYFSDLMSKSLQPALDDQKRLYDCGMVDQYLTLSTYYSEEDALRAEQRCVGWPTYLVLRSTAVRMKYRKIRFRRNCALNVSS